MPDEQLHRIDDEIVAAIGQIRAIHQACTAGAVAAALGMGDKSYVVRRCEAMRGTRVQWTTMSGSLHLVGDGSAPSVTQRAPVPTESPVRHTPKLVHHSPLRVSPSVILDDDGHPAPPMDVSDPALERSITAGRPVERVHTTPVTVTPDGTLVINGTEVHIDRAKLAELVGPPAAPIDPVPERPVKKAAPAHRPPRAKPERTPEQVEADRERMAKLRQIQADKRAAQHA